ncbi:hypothetical protein [Alkalihalobacterium elongatum]|nr:hypothetical protein [Alkalihalobacterium elongatum]
MIEQIHLYVVDDSAQKESSLLNGFVKNVHKQTKQYNDYFMQFLKRTGS